MARDLRTVLAGCWLDCKEKKTMNAWLHHIVFDPLSKWKEFKVELLILPFALVIFAAWCGFRGRNK